MRIRTLKPEFFQSETIASLSFPARILYQGMWCFADDHGRGRANPKLVKAAVFPLDDDMGIEDVTLLMKEVFESGMAHPYEVGGKDYYHVVQWIENQSAAFRRGNPIHPAPTCMQDDASCDDLEQVGMHASAGTGNREQVGGSRDASPHRPEPEI